MKTETALFAHRVAIAVMIGMATLAAAQTNRTVTPKPVGPVALTPGQAPVVYGSSAVVLPPRPKPSFTTAWDWADPTNKIASVTAMTGHASGDYGATNLIPINVLTNSRITWTDLSLTCPYVVLISENGTNGAINGTNAAAETWWNPPGPNGAVYLSGKDNAMYFTWLQAAGTVYTIEATTNGPDGPGYAIIYGPTRAGSNSIARLKRPVGVKEWYRISRL